MRLPLQRLRRALTWRDWWPAVRGGLGVALLFGAGLWLTRHYAAPIESALDAHQALGVAVFIGTTVVAVLLPMMSNLALVPVAVLAWGPAWTAVMLLTGWVIGATLAFVLGRYAQAWILVHLPSVRRHADIDRLIHPGHRLGSLVLLRMTFPVDILSYALGLFSRQTTTREVLWSTLVGAAPFAAVFAWFPTLDGQAQVTIFVASTVLFVVYAYWVLHRPAPAAG